MLSPQKPVTAHALYDYNRTHTDELSFKKGDVITVSQQLDGGWWEGALDGSVGWFPSNYVSLSAADLSDTPAFSKNNTTAHLQNFQDEIVQHILEGEVRQVNELIHLISSILVHLEKFTFLPFLNKIYHMKEILTQAVHLHQDMVAALNDIKQSSEPKRVGKLFLQFAPLINALGCDYSKIHLYVITGLDKNADMIIRHMSSIDVNFNLERCKQQLSLVFDRLGRYPLLLKEMERYLENPHVDREDIQCALNIYGEITERCAILRKFKEYDIEILLSTIKGWHGPPLEKLGDPVLTLRVALNDLDQDPMQPKRQSSDWTGRLCVLVTFPTCVLLLGRTKQPDVYDFMTKIPLNTLIVVACSDIENDIDLIVGSETADRKSVVPGRLALSCADRNARDLLVSTLNDLINYQSLADRASWAPMSDPSHRSTATTSSSGDNVGASGSTESPPRANDAQPDSTQGCVDTSSSTQSLQSTSPSRQSCTPTNLPMATKVTGNTESEPSPVPRTLRTLSHQITASAHVRWPDKPKNEGPFVPGCIRSIRLDGPLNLTSCAASSSRACSFVNLGSGISSSGMFHGRSDGTSQSGDRPHSPKGDHWKEARRKKSDRQKSAINVDDVLRSVDKLRDDERRNADAARILQVVEAYCSSSWTNVAWQSVDVTQLNLKGLNNQNGATLLSPSKSLLHPTTPVSQSSSSAISSTKPSSQLESFKGTESAAQNISPPPVVLPTQSGRRI